MIDRFSFIEQHIPNIGNIVSLLPKNPAEVTFYSFLEA